MKKTWILLAAATALISAPSAVQTHAGLFKMDFGQIENEKIPIDPETLEPTGEAPAPLTDWTVIATWTFTDPNANVIEGSASATGTANAAGTEVTWNLKDYSSDADNDVTLTMLDNRALAESINPEEPPYMLGQTANNPGPLALSAVYDGILVPAIVKDDYIYRNPDTTGSEVLMRFANLKAGFYNVTVFEGRTNDANGRFGKVWVDDITGSKEPATQNTGNYSGVNDKGIPTPLGQPRTVTVNLAEGQYLWFAEMEDNSGGISGMIIRSVEAPPPPIDISKSKGLYKIDFSSIENERVPVDGEGNPTGDAPAKLADWNVIATWTFAEPNVNVLPDSASVEATVNSEGTEATWKLTDFSSEANKNVTVTMLDNAALTATLGIEAMLGQTGNNPTKEAYDAVYDGVTVPAIVKDDYLYRNADAAGSEVLMRFAGLTPGKYNVTVFEGRTTDGNGRFGKVWVDDITGAKEPAAQNTGNYSGVNLDVGGVATPVGNPRTVTVDLAAGQYLWFAEMEDNSGGISGMIIRGLPAATPAASLVGSATLAGPFTAVAGTTVDATAKTITVAAPSASTYYRVDGGTGISITSSGANLVIKYQ
jgi:uncharacterized protein (DUF2141 family)